ncbi:uncharacterized protein CELE_F58F9.1 [Caenorhabditis elegans]|uniref:Uncharacterized protein n=1 Tax=Caenorhabditis elegans TaxID=6239 RepID=Q20993_CAEEL|nr:Uncharacterized protein CELE_F58F9.1 [Caenorhabditis elegans]CCD67640.2 Uncharacterized protein CELE_F58F9.1 [Caenorhabditis elegans]|eukprot:NP_500944.3 Uncharacterized protein CELE_F58F9.1 [Caenorhabditis elegans]
MNPLYSDPRPAVVPQPDLYGRYHWSQLTPSPPATDSVEPTVTPELTTQNENAGQFSNTVEKSRKPRKKCTKRKVLNDFVSIQLCTTCLKRANFNSPLLSLTLCEPCIFRNFK